MKEMAMIFSPLTAYYEPILRKFQMLKNILFLMLFSALTLAQAPADRTITCAFWNVENLFDIFDDPGTSDEEFAVGGVKNVDEANFRLKVSRLAEGLKDLNADILGLCEVENRYVLDQLNLAYPDRNYSIVHYNSPDSRGIDVALLYDPEKIIVLDTESIPVHLPENKDTRDILHVTVYSKGSLLHVFINHWPSKYGGVEATIPLRAEAGRTLRTVVDNILANDPAADILIMGDLNDEPHEPSITEHLGARLYSPDNTDFILTDLMTPYYKVPGKGTYKYRGADSVIDHIIISRGLVDGGGWTADPKTVNVLDEAKYRQQSGNYTGYPFRFWAGNNLLGGYSDHLAVSVKLLLPK